MALLVATMMGLSACGGDDGEGEVGSQGGGKATGEQGARAALVEFTDGIVDRRFADACAVTSEAAKQQNRALGDCEDALKQVRGFLDADDFDKYKQHAREAKITVRGKRAIVAPVKGEEDPSYLIRQGNRWLIDAHPGADTTSSTSTTQERE